MGIEEFSSLSRKTLFLSHEPHESDTEIPYDRRVERSVAFTLKPEDSSTSATQNTRP